MKNTRSLLRALCSRLPVRTANQFIRDRAGSMVVLFAITLPVVIGLGAVAVEMGLLYVQQRQIQTAADAAAIAGALEIVHGNAASLQQAASREVLRNGVSGGTEVVNNPPQTGPNVGNNAAVEVLLSIEQPSLFSSLFGRDSATVSARAVAAPKVKGYSCIMALDPTEAAAVNISASTQVNIDCWVAVNSSSASAIDINNSGSLQAASLYAVGNYAFSSSIPAQLTEAPVVQAEPLADPYAGTTIPGLGPCDETNLVLSGGVFNISPGVYCGGLRTINSTTVNLAPGTYYIDAGDLSFASDSTIRCDCPNPTDGVTFVLTSSDAGSTIGTVQIAGNADIVLNAPTDPTAEYQGMLFFQDPRADPDAPSRIRSATLVTLNGSMYFPSSPVVFAGNNVTSAAPCTVIVARTLSFEGSSAVTFPNCPDISTAEITEISLIE